MPQILLFGATGYTGRLTAHALSRLGADFAIAGRNEDRLRALARATGDPEIRIAEAGDLGSLVKALDGVRVLITVVGPFVDLGQTAVEAALRARVHYIDSTGEGEFIKRLIDRRSEAEAAGIAMAPALAFDEVPADVAATLAVNGFEQPELNLTYAMPSGATQGTILSTLGIITSTGRWIEDGRSVPIKAGEAQRWAPMPPPLGPRLGISFPLASGWVLPLHLQLSSFRTYVTARTPQRIGTKVAAPVLRVVQGTSAGRRLIDSLVGRLPEGPDDNGRKARWTILAEASTDGAFRNVVVSGRDPYGLSAELLALGSLTMAADDYDRSGVLAPVEAVGLETLHKVLIEQGVTTETFPE
jgi:short subunit dehydrogenase-like uncharacterized protein